MKKIFLVISLIFISISLVFYFYVIEIFQKVEIFRMKNNGVTEIINDQFHYFEKNNCTNDNIETKQCQCVLLLHGLGDFALTWRKTLSKEKNFFSKDTHFFAPNLPGALLTPKLSSLDEYNVQKLAKKISDFFLPKCSSWIVMGNSYGGWLSVFVALNSNNVKGLLLLGPAGIREDYSSVANYFLNPTVEGARSFYKKIYYNEKQIPDFILQRVVERLKDQVVVEQLRSVTEEDFLNEYLGDLNIPVVYVWGESDEVIPVGWSETFIKATPNSKLKIIKNCGHVPQKECTREVLSELNALMNRI